MIRIISKSRHAVSYLVCACLLMVPSLPTSAESPPQGAVYHPPLSVLEVTVKTTRITTRYLDGLCSVKERYSETFDVGIAHKLVAQSSCELDLGRHRGRWATGEVTALFSPPRSAQQRQFHGGGPRWSGDPERFPAGGGNRGLVDGVVLLSPELGE